MLLDALAEDAVLSPYDELIAFESLYSEKGMTLSRVASETVLKGRLPSEAYSDLSGLIPRDDVILEVRDCVDAKIGGFSIAVNGTLGWPRKLEDSARPTPILYYRGDLGLLDSTSVSVVGSRKASDAGCARARRLARELVQAGATIVTGLARGIDTEAANAALDARGSVIGVIGTPIDEAYPKENRDLHDRIARDHLLISQVPFFRYAKEPFRAHRAHFPERNELMASVSDATVIVEASDTSGTLIQARACMHQGRPLFLLRSLVDNDEVSWPKRFMGQAGVFALEDTQQILDVIKAYGGKR